MSDNGTIKSGGSVVFWMASASSRAKLSEGLDKLGRGKLLPESKSSYKALFDAANDVYNTNDFIIRSLKGNVGVTIIKEAKGEQENDWKKIDSLFVDQDGNLLPCCREDEVSAAYQRQRGVLDASAITDLMVGAVYAASGVSLRPSGGFYWVRDDKLAEVRAIAEAAKTASLNGQTSVFFLNICHDEDMCEAVVAALTNEIVSDVAKMTEEIDSGDLGKRALETRRSRAIALTAKVTELAGVLGANLSTLTTALEQIKTKAAEAIIVEAASNQADNEVINPMDVALGVPSDL